MSKNSTTQKKPKVISGVPEKVTHVPPLTIKKLADKLVEIEKKEGYQMALVAVECLNYQEVCKIACDKGKDNDPHLMPSRFMIVYGATDEGLKKKKNLDKFPHELHDDIDEEMSVERLRYYLGLMGYYQGPWRHLEEDQDEDDDSDAEEHDISATLQGDLFGALCNYIKCSAPLFSFEIPEKTEFKATSKNSLSEIASKFGIRDWTLLIEKNKASLGETHDIVRKDAVISIPPSKSKEMEDWLKKHKWDDQYGEGRGFHYPGKYLSFSIVDGDAKIKEYAEGASLQIYLTHPRLELIVDVKIKKGDEIDFMVPDTEQIVVWIEGEKLSGDKGLAVSFDTYKNQVDAALEMAAGISSKNQENGDPFNFRRGAPEEVEDDSWFHLPKFDFPDFSLPSFDLPKFENPLKGMSAPSSLGSDQKLPDLPALPSLPQVKKGLF
ncbi:MAG: hypothetical protein IPO40_09930 [Fibrobacteres bacterium]|nr:hypothetical protein [Fibrobacterota bacterium]